MTTPLRLTVVLFQASVNHHRIAEGLGKALVEISEELEDCVNSVNLMNVADMRQAIGNLYSHIFHFLQCAMQWFQSKSWKKVLNSLTEDFYDVFEDQIVKIKKLSSRILLKSSFKSQTELRDLRLQITREAEQSAKERAATRDHQIRNSTAIEQKLSELKDTLGQLVGLRMSECLRANLTSWLHKPQEDPHTTHSISMSRRVRLLTTMLKF